MYVTVSLGIELDATASLTQMEQQIQQAGREAMKEALKQAIQQSGEQQKRCPACGSEQVRTRGTKRRVLLTSFGRVEVPLKRLRCHQCHQLFRPAESCLAEVQGHNVTPDLRELAALVGSSWPYETAAGVLNQLSGVQVSDERLRQLTNEQGSILAQQQHEQAQQVLHESVSMELIRAQRDHKASVRKNHLEWLQVGLDGGWVPCREQKEGMEGKIGVIASQVDAVGKQGRHRLSRRRYVATFGPADEVGLLTYTAACELGATEAKRQIVLGDGADWIKTQANEHFPDAVKVPLPVEDALRYLETQQDWMGNYQQWQADGYPVGSGLVERAVAIVINMRMKKRGMRWKRANATAVVAVRVQRINAEWDAAA
jgi:hypothetical protein